MGAEMGIRDFSKSEFVERGNDLPINVTLGVQYGDEGKGKITDILNQEKGTKKYL